MDLNSTVLNSRLQRFLLLFCSLSKLTAAAAHEPVITELNYCNALYTGVSQSSFGHLQLVQNAAAKDHITPVLAVVHWVEYTIQTKGTKRFDYKCAV